MMMESIKRAIRLGTIFNDEQVEEIIEFLDGDGYDEIDEMYLDYLLNRYDDTQENFLNLCIKDFADTKIKEQYRNAIIQICSYRIMIENGKGFKKC